MVIKTYFDKSNTIIKDQFVNTGLNPVTELFYGGDNNRFSRFIFHFDETKLRHLYTGGTYTDISKLKHTLYLTNTGSFDKSLLNGQMAGMDRAISFDLILFKINQMWDSGVGYDYRIPLLLNGEIAYDDRPSNWFEAQTNVFWSGGSGIYSGSASAITLTTQHFDKGNENIKMDITSYVNGLLTGDTNYGLGIAYSQTYETLNTSTPQYVGFFTNNTQTFYEPYIETTYDNHIIDDRNNFFLDKNNKLYLYVNLAGQPTNLDILPSVTIYDNDGNIFSAYTSSEIMHITKGAYSIDINVPTNQNNVDSMYNDVWSNIQINGLTKPDVTLSFVVKDSACYYNIGDNSMLPKKIAVSIGGIQHNEKIKRGDIRKVIVSARIPYTVEQTQIINSLKYRIYVKEGTNELTVIDYQPVELTSNYYYFLIDTESLLPNIYFIDILAESNLEVTTLTNVMRFEIINQVEIRNSQ